MAYKKITKAKAKNKTYVGFCHNKSHRGHITKEVMQQKECCSKVKENPDGTKELYVCPFFKPNEGHSYWIEKEHAKIMRKVKKKYVDKGILARDAEVKELCKEFKWQLDAICEYIANLY